MKALSADPIRVLIVDDEPAARRGIVQLLERDPDFSIVGECSTGAEMLDAVDRVRPDLLFLDIEMPGLDGFGALAQLEERAPLIVFVTGYDRYAVKAFEARAIDYVLKPYTEERFARACRHAKRQLRQRRSSADLDYQERLLALLTDLRDRDGSARAQFDAQQPFLVKKSQGRTVIVSPETVLWVEARKDYLCLHTRDGKYLVRETMKRAEQRMDPKQFVRIHRSAIVRTDCIAEVVNLKEGKMHVTLTNGTELPLSAAGYRKLQQQFGM